MNPTSVNQRTLLSYIFQRFHDIILPIGKGQFCLEKGQFCRPFCCALKFSIVLSPRLFMAGEKY